MARLSTNRRARRSLGVAAALTFGAVGCNAIFGIDAGHLVPAGTDAGSGGKGDGGSPSVDSGAGGSGASPQDSGSDVTASGGIGGAGGKGGTAGKGGSSGAGGRGGSAGTEDGGGDAGPLTGPFGVKGEVQCDTASCKLPGQACCVALADGASHCSASCDSSTQVRFACDGAEDCTSGQHCCYGIGATTASCASSCTGKIFCGSARDCLPGQACELGGGALSKVYVCTDVPKAKTVWCGGAPCDLSGGKNCCYDKAKTTETCTATACTGSNAVSFTCDAADDCGTGGTCCESHTGLGVPTGTSCNAAVNACASGHSPVECGGEADCGAGLHCCLSGSGTTCLASCTGATACDTDADCPVGQTCSVEISTAFGAPTGRTRCATP